MIKLTDGNCFGNQSLTPLFFSFDEIDIERAKAICRSCSAIYRCRAYAQDNNIDIGVWGGLSEVDRRKARERNFPTLLEELHSIFSPQSTPHDTNRLESESLFSPSHMSFQQSHTPLVSCPPLAFQPSCYTFDIAS